MCPNSICAARSARASSVASLEPCVDTPVAATATLCGLSLLLPLSNAFLRPLLATLLIDLPALGRLVPKASTADFAADPSLGSESELGVGGDDREVFLRDLRAAFVGVRSIDVIFSGRLRMFKERIINRGVRVGMPPDGIRDGVAGVVGVSIRRVFDRTVCSDGNGSSKPSFKVWSEIFW
jgi:hypothetical protein